MSILVTGAAGFIGYHLSAELIKKGFNITSIDNMNSYYDVSLKHSRIKNLEDLSKTFNKKFKLYIGDIADKPFLEEIFLKNKTEVVINLAAQAGVRNSIENPSSYISSNLVGFSNILECCRFNNIKHLIYASSSSVYGGNKNMPFSESQGVDHPVSLYAATKRSNELMAHSYSHLFSIPSSGLRFFTVYGPWGRPDMALFLFTKQILEGKPINVYNNGNMIRDFTYIDDIVESIVRLIDRPPSLNSNFDYKNPNPGTSWAPHKIYNIGNADPITLMEYIKAIEDALSLKAEKILMPMQPGDVTATSADTSELESWIGFKPKTPIKDGVKNFVSWYKDYYNF